MDIIECRKLSQRDIQIPPGESITAMTTWHDYVLIVTDRGTVFRLQLGEWG